MLGFFFFFKKKYSTVIPTKNLFEVKSGVRTTGERVQKTQLVMDLWAERGRQMPPLALFHSLFLLLLPVLLVLILLVFLLLLSLPLLCFHFLLILLLLFPLLFSLPLWFAGIKV